MALFNLEVSARHVNSPVCQLLQEDRKFRVFIQPELQVDFSPGRSCGILYLAEEEIVLLKEGEWRGRLQVLASYPQSFVIVEKTSLTEQFFNQIQLEACFGLPNGQIVNVMPVGGPDDGARFLKHLTNQEAGETEINLKGGAKRAWDQKLVDSLANVPGVGKTKANSLLSEFHSLTSLAGASQEEICQRVPSARGAAKPLKTFWNEPL